MSKITPSHWLLCIFSVYLYFLSLLPYGVCGAQNWTFALLASSSPLLLLYWSCLLSFLHRKTLFSFHLFHPILHINFPGGKKKKEKLLCVVGLKNKSNPSSVFLSWFDWSIDLMLWMIPTWKLSFLDPPSLLFINLEIFSQTKGKLSFFFLVVEKSWKFLWSMSSWGFLKFVLVFTCSMWNGRLSGLYQ